MIRASQLPLLFAHMAADAHAAFAGDFHFLLMPARRQADDDGHVGDDCDYAPRPHRAGQAARRHEPTGHAASL